MKKIIIWFFNLFNRREEKVTVQEDEKLITDEDYIKYFAKSTYEGKNPPEETLDIQMDGLKSKHRSEVQVLAIDSFEAFLKSPGNNNARIRARLALQNLRDHLPEVLE